MVELFDFVGWDFCFLPKNKKPKIHIICLGRASARTNSFQIGHLWAFDVGDAESTQIQSIAKKKKSGHLSKISIEKLMLFVHTCVCVCMCVQCDQEIKRNNLLNLSHNLQAMKRFIYLNTYRFLWHCVTAPQWQLISQWSLLMPEMIDRMSIYSVRFIQW